jgi:hypothetical protein
VSTFILPSRLTLLRAKSKTRYQWVLIESRFFVQLQSKAGVITHKVRTHIFTWSIDMYALSLSVIWEIELSDHNAVGGRGVH